jgi:D-psicose/D-tagatose/L-ribulose 3-epimerase
LSTFGLHLLALAPGWDISRIEPQVERFGEHGIGLIEVPLRRPSDIGAGRARAFAGRYGLELNPTLSLPRAIDIVDAPQDGLDFLEPMLRVASELGSPSLSGMIYGSVGKLTGHAPTTREIDGICRFIERAARLAKAGGIRLGIEPFHRYETHLVNTAGAAAGIIERVGAENLFIHLDSFHMQIEEESFAAALKVAEPYLGYVQVAESNRGVPGRGMTDWLALFKAMAEVGYRGPVVLDCPVGAEGEAAATLALWRPLARHAEEVIEEGLPVLREAAKKAGFDLG